jgi:hypothetical protein
VNNFRFPAAPVSDGTARCSKEEIDSKGKTTGFMFFLRRDFVF